MKTQTTSEIIGGVAKVFNEAENCNVLNFLPNNQPKPSKQQHGVLDSMRASQVINMKQIALKVLVNEMKKTASVQSQPSSPMDQLYQQDQLQRKEKALLANSKSQREIQILCDNINNE